MAEAVVAMGEAPEEGRRTRDVNRVAVLCMLVEAMLAVGAEKSLARLIDHALSCDKFDLIEVHLAAMSLLEKTLGELSRPSEAITRWVSHCRQKLAQRTLQAPQEPTDYRRTSKLSCNCRDCAALAAFLADPNQKQARFPLAKQRRQHMHRVIEAARCDCTHNTERIGRPFTLVCTKTTASYQAACAIYSRDEERLARVTRIEQKL